MTYETKNFDNLLGTTGFSDQLLKNHFTLYQGYVTNTNKLTDTLATIVKEGKTGTPEFAELQRRFGWEFNGMRLHELYFSNMKNGGHKISNGELKKCLAYLFGSYEDWEKAFKAVGAMRGIGWVIMYYDKEAKKLFNIWINEHDVGHLTTAVPILVMDVFEHAYMLDYELKKVDYINNFINAIDWEIVEKRFKEAQ